MENKYIFAIIIIIVIIIILCILFTPKMENFTQEQILTQTQTPSQTPSQPPIRISSEEESQLVNYLTNFYNFISPYINTHINNLSEQYLTDFESYKYILDEYKKYMQASRLIPANISFQSEEGQKYLTARNTFLNNIKKYETKFGDLGERLFSALEYENFGKNIDDQQNYKVILKSIVINKVYDEIVKLYNEGKIPPNLLNNNVNDSESVKNAIALLLADRK